MTLTSVAITKKSVSEVMDGQWSVTWTLSGFDGTEVITDFEKDFSEDYKKGDDISRVEAGFKRQMQAYIDSYKEEQSYLVHTKMNTAISNVQTVLSVQKALEV